MYAEWLFCSSKGVPKGIFLFERKPLVEFTHLDLDSSTFKDAYCIYSHLRVHMPFVYLEIIVMIGFFRPIPRLRPSSGESLYQALEVFDQLHYGEVESAVAGGCTGSAAKSP